MATRALDDAAVFPPILGSGLTAASLFFVRHSGVNYSISRSELALALGVGGGLAAPRVITAAVSTVTMSAGEVAVVINKSVSSATAVTLPPSPVAGQRARVTDGKGDLDIGENEITVSPAAGTINGVADVLMRAARMSLLFEYNGTEWNIT